MTYGLFFGDSITYGEYDGIHGGWVDLVKRYALKKYNENFNQVIIFNLGIGGETTEGLVKRMPYEMSARSIAEKRFVFIGYGANDLAYKNNNQVVNPEQFITNIKTTIEIAKHYCKDIYLISILPISENIDSKTDANSKLRSNKDVNKYNEIIKKLAQENNLEYIDFFSEFIKDKEKFLSKDGIHPNENGYEMISKMVVPIIDKYL